MPRRGSVLTDGPTPARATPTRTTKQPLSARGTPLPQLTQATSSLERRPPVSSLSPLPSAPRPATTPGMSRQRRPAPMGSQASNGPSRPGTSNGRITPSAVQRASPTSRLPSKDTSVPQDKIAKGVTSSEGHKPAVDVAAEPHGDPAGPRRTPRRRVVSEGHELHEAASEARSTPRSSPLPGPSSTPTSPQERQRGLGPDRPVVPPVKRPVVPAPCGKRRPSRKLLKSGSTDTQDEDDPIRQRMFEIADEDHTGFINYSDFLKVHRSLVQASNNTGNHRAVQALEKDLLQQVGRVEEDSGGGAEVVEYEEFARYLDSFTAALGHRMFVQLCSTMQEHFAKSSDAAARFDIVASERLLEKVISATSFHGHVVTEIQHLLNGRANPNFADKFGSSSFYYAAEKCDLQVVSLLLAARADPKWTNLEYDSPALMAARHRNIEVVRFLFTPKKEKEREGRPFEAVAAPEGRESQQLSIDLVSGMSGSTARDVQELLQRKADINFRDNKGWTPLISAVFWGKVDCVEQLVKYTGGARLKVDTRNVKGCSALHIAARKGRANLVPLLVAGRAEVDLQDFEGWTPLHHASFNGMDQCVHELVKCKPHLLAQGKNGFTPWMVSSLPEHAGTLLESSLKLLEPVEQVNFSKRIIPILSDKTLPPYEKLDAIYRLPGVNYVLTNLRIYEQFFSVRTGPNKVRLRKMWDGLVVDMLRRLRSGETDVRSLEGESEQARRRTDQRNFLTHWFKETMGPPPSADWQHDSREPYRAELEHVIKEEMAGFRKEYDAVYAKLKTHEFGATLCELRAHEVVKEEYLTQLRAHPYLPWLDTLDVSAAFAALRNVNALGSSRDIEEALSKFVDLIGNHPDFETADDFWKNIYKLWLGHYATLAQQDFVNKVKAVVNSFNDRFIQDGFRASLRIAPPKSYERIRIKERQFGTPSNETTAQRCLASHILDPVHLAVTVSQPRAVLLLLDEFFRPLTITKDRLELVQVINNFSKDVQSENGYRSLVMNVHWDGGMRTGYSGDKTELRMSLVGEVQIVMDDFVSIKKRMHVIDRYLAGDFDHKRSYHRTEKASSDD